ncbi:bifunctional phosphoglucose/phosphomannose isomerase [Candidatus Bathyarchaeota archaeon]|nr:MAG: bifunctional phosphoglucose/phosphomannose isomerase [Candidatus Bathyarchaeota archaeon]
MPSVLDDPKYIKQLDPDGMLETITDFPNSARKAIQNTEGIRFKVNGGDYDTILVAGMGGSAVGGLLLRDWLMDTLRISITVSRGYHLPAWVNENTLIYAVSYSGNTEETLSQYREAVDRGCTVICFCSGGTLAERAKENDHILVKFPKGLQPRAAIPHQFYNLAGVTRRIGLISDSKWEEIEESIRVAEEHCAEMKPEVPLGSNTGKKLAEEIKGYIPFIYAPQLFMSIAYRYSTQFNENSKSPAATNFYPEAFHNSIMAREAGKELLGNICAVIIRDPEGEKRLNKKIDESVELMRESFGKVVEVMPRGVSNLARMMSALIQGDFTSAYLGLLYGVDPSTTESIRILKASLKD